LLYREPRSIVDELLGGLVGLVIRVNPNVAEPASKSVLHRATRALVDRLSTATTCLDAPSQRVANWSAVEPDLRVSSDGLINQAVGGLISDRALEEGDRAG